MRFLPVLVPCLSLLSACTTFSSVRSAALKPGHSLLVQKTWAASPGDEAGWFWSYDCASNCGGPIAALDINYSFSPRPYADGDMPFSFGLGVNGTFPYIEGYLQFSQSSTNPYGVGARLGITGPWSEHALYLRVDRRLAPDLSLLYNPGYFIHSGNSPNGENPGTFSAMTHGVGLQFGTGKVLLIPSVTIVHGSTRRSSYGRETKGSTTFPTFSAGVMLRQ